MDTVQIEERIRSVAKDTDGLIMKLDTLVNRIDTAKSNDNKELVEYYERQFAEASVEFMNGVETILDDWYALKGTPRPPADQEVMPPELLDEIHNTVVAIVQGASDGGTRTDRTKQTGKTSRIETASPRVEADRARQDTLEFEPQKDRKGPGGKVDVKG
ncbi:MAG: hypothetical protein LBS45_06365 [Synergistaceae bacterium]|nr:hypothetical protein [Synergistaceae bacterium]